MNREKQQQNTHTLIHFSQFYEIWLKSAATKCIYSYQEFTSSLLDDHRGALALKNGFKPHRILQDGTDN